jgi:hypothetical protein
MGRLGTPISCAFATVGLTLRQDWLKTKELLLLSLSKKRIAEQRLVCRRCSVSRRTTSDRPNQQGWTTDRLESSQPISDSPRGFHGYASCPEQIAPETSGMGQDYNAVLQSPCGISLLGGQDVSCQVTPHVNCMHRSNIPCNCQMLASVLCICIQDDSYNSTPAQ